MTDELEDFLASVPDLIEVVPVAQAISGPRGTRIIVCSVVILTTSVVLLVLTTGESLGDTIGKPQSSEARDDMLWGLWQITDDIGTDYPLGGGGASGQGLYSMGTVIFRSPVPAEARFLYAKPKAAETPFVIELGSGRPLHR